MKREGRIISLFLLGLFILSIVAVCVSAADTQSVGQQVSGTISSLFSGTGDFQGTLSKILLIVLVVLLVYSIFSFVPIFPQGNPYLQWGVSIIVGVLSFLFVSVDDIKYILINYEALGVMLTTILPLIIIVVFTVRLEESKVRYANLINKIIILGFAIYVGVRWWTIPSGTATTMQWLYPATIIGLLIWLFIEKMVARALQKEERKEAGEKAQVESQDRRLIELQAMIKDYGRTTDTSSAPARRLKADIDQLAKELGVKL